MPMFRSLQTGAVAAIVQLMAAGFIARFKTLGPCDRCVLKQSFPLPQVGNLFIWPAKAAVGKSMTREGYNILGWTQGGSAFWAVTDLEANELRQFQQAMTAAVPP